MAAGLPVQFVAAVKMKMFSKQNVTVLRVKITIFEPKISILRPFRHQLNKHGSKRMAAHLLVQFSTGRQDENISKSFFDRFEGNGIC